MLFCSAREAVRKTHPLSKSLLITYRIVPWGMPMSTNEIPYLKGIGIRIHTVRYQKVRRVLDIENDGENDDENDVTTKERRRMRGKHYRVKLCNFFFDVNVLRSLNVFPNNYQLPRKGG